MRSELSRRYAPADGLVSIGGVRVWDQSALHGRARMLLAPLRRSDDGPDPLRQLRHALHVSDADVLRRRLHLSSQGEGGGGSRGMAVSIARRAVPWMVPGRTVIGRGARSSKT